MHLNVHFAFGIIIASITSIFYPNITLIEFLIIVSGSFIVDFDFFFVNFVKEKNHRQFITHTIYFPILIIIFGIILNNIIIIIAGINYLIHLSMDCLDWGIRTFHTSKVHGLFLLLNKEEKIDVLNGNDKYIHEQLKINKHFFEEKYYGNFTIVSIDIIISFLGFFILFLIKPDFWYLYFGFLVTLFYHMYFKIKSENVKPMKAED